MPRDEFAQAVKNQLASRTGYKCSNPFCRRTTIGPQLEGSNAINIGEAAHICAAAPGGKRYNASMTEEERKSYDNGIWLCRTHAAMIDRDELYFTVEMLQKWKEDAESDAGKELIGQDVVKKCKFRMLIFYNDLCSCQKVISLLKMQRGASVDGTLLPVQSNWESHIEEISDSIGVELTATLYNILREIEEFKIAMEDIGIKTNGRRTADNNTIKYCRRYDIFVERMSDWLTDNFMNALKIFTELS